MKHRQHARAALTTGRDTQATRGKTSGSRKRDRIAAKLARLVHLRRITPEQAKNIRDRIARNPARYQEPPRPRAEKRWHTPPS